MNTSITIIKNERERIKRKLNIWLEYIIKEKDVYEAVRKFEEIFEGEYILDCEEDIEEDYYEGYIDTYYLKNKMKLVQIYGPHDKFGNMTSHKGDDLVVYSELSNNEKFAENGIDIFFESEYSENAIETLKKLINEDIGFEAVYGFKKDNEFKVTDIDVNGDYENFGKKIVEFIRETSIEKMKEIFDKIILVKSLENAISKEIDKYKDKTLEEKIEKVNCLRKSLKNTIGDLEKYRDDINSKYMIDKQDKLYITNFGYIVDLDDEKLDIYWQDVVIASYSLCNIPIDWNNKCVEELKRQVIKK